MHSKAFSYTLIHGSHGSLKTVKVHEHEKKEIQALKIPSFFCKNINKIWDFHEPVMFCCWSRQTSLCLIYRSTVFLQTYFADKPRRSRYQLKIRNRQIHGNSKNIVDDIMPAPLQPRYKSMSHLKFGNQPEEVAAFSAAKQPLCGWRFQPQIDPIQYRGTFLWTVISKSWPWIIRSKIVIFRISSISATISHAEIIFRTVIKKLWAFFGLGVEYSNRDEYSNPRPQWGRHGYCLTRKHESLHEWWVNAGQLSAKSAHHYASIASAPRVCWGTAAPQFSNGLTKDDYLRGNGSVSLFIQRIGSVSAMLVA